MTTDLVPADNMAALEALTTAEREAAVTHMLTEARDWLAHAKEATGPAEIATFKAQMATVAEATKQLNLSKEIQLDAQEMVRRAERGVGVAIRDGQERGEIRVPGDRGSAPGPYTRVHSGREQHITPVSADSTTKSSPEDYASHHRELIAMYAVTDDVTEEQFEEVITEAKAEGNLARANVVRKIKEQPGPVDTSRASKADLIAELAATGHASRQMVAKVGVSEEWIRQTARDFNIEIPADKALGKAVRVDSTDVVRNIVTGYENAPSGESAINWLDVDPTEADEWVDSLVASIGAARAFIRKIQKIKESTHV